MSIFIAFFILLKFDYKDGGISEILIELIDGITENALGTINNG